MGHPCHFIPLFIIITVIILPVFYVNIIISQNDGFQNKNETLRMQTNVKNLVIKLYIIYEKVYDVIINWQKKLSFLKIY